MSGEPSQQLFDTLTVVEAPVRPVARKNSLPDLSHVIAVVELVRAPARERFVEPRGSGDAPSVR